MKYFLDGHDANTAAQDTLICLLPDEAHVRELDAAALCGDYIISTVRISGDTVHSGAELHRSGCVYRGSCVEAFKGDETERKRGISYAVKTSIFKAVLQVLEHTPLWGSMTGVKPAKPVRLHFDGDIDEIAAHELLKERYFVEKSRRDIAISAAKYARECEQTLKENETQLYIGIPFCPAKCSYCSFVSNVTAKTGHLIEPYTQVLLREIAAGGELMRRHKLRLGSIYIGGGTPTTLNENQLERLMSAVREHFDTSNICEFTVEAGRPETINEAKLKIISQGGVGRISINPQTMNDDVLRGVGRLHTAQDVVSCYEMARRVGSYAINMDLIAGLPGDSEDSLFDSVRRVCELEPENITIHALALKKGAQLRFGKRGELNAYAVDRCYEYLYAHGYKPYYLYRQKYIAGGLENIGFCKDGYASHYNICMMEELSDILALGAGGVTKLCSQGGRKIVRMANPKYAPEYIDAAERIICEKTVNISV